MSYKLEVNTVGTSMLDVVDDGGRNEIKREGTTQTIVWELQGGNAVFFPIGGSCSGFTWIPGPYDLDPFQDPVLSKDGRKITIKVRHKDVHTAGPRVYMLRAQDRAGNVYSTMFSDGRTVTINNPVIVNR